MVTSVHRPLCKTSVVHLIEVTRLVNGEATDASPNATLFSSSSASARACMCSSQDLACFLDFFFFPSCAFVRPSIASRCFASKSGTLIIDIPQCDIFSAPTSLVPSPHIRVIRPAPLNAATTASFCLGACLANTEMRGTRLCNVDCASGCSKTVFGSMKVLLVPPESCLIFRRTASVAIFVRVSPVTQTAAIFDDASIPLTTSKLAEEYAMHFLVSRLAVSVLLTGTKANLPASTPCFV
mmetsp:Transcript_17629/g.26339  ORF Transcript_17629/g.26339 Transcript_17629/m.26339 type:complete len:239 (-) Transcript_17629:2826-3542(-)